MDNLQGITYQTFEQDPVKYQNYEEVRTGNFDPASIKFNYARRLCTRLYQIGLHQKGCEYIGVESSYTCNAGIALESSVWRELEGALWSRGV
jgi:hypothetical protein